MKEKSREIFKIRYHQEDEKIIEEVFNSLIPEYKDILNYLGINTIGQMSIIICHTKKELDALIRKIHPDWFDDKIPNWLNGFVGGENDLYVLSPNNKETCHDKQSILSVFKHEFIHIVANAIEVVDNIERPLVLDEGIATFLSNQTSQRKEEFIRNEIKQNKLLPIIEFCGNNTQSFADKKGYIYAYYIMKCLNDVYGRDNIIYWLAHPQNFLDNLQNINNTYVDYMKNNYSVLSK